MIKIGIIGVGFMGELHIKAYSKIDSVEIIGIYDADLKRLQEISNKYGVRIHKNYSDLIEEADAVSICAPTVLHYNYAKECINENKHIFIEKPIAGTLGEAQELAMLSAKKEVKTQVGYIERFNPAIIKIKELINGNKVINISARRLAPPLTRANDVSAVFDLMIHDIDIVISILNSNPMNIKAKGEKINSLVVNKAEADLQFDDEVNANIIADKTAEKKERKIEIICDDAVYVADLISREIWVNNRKNVNSKREEMAKTLTFPKRGLFEPRASGAELRRKEKGAVFAISKNKGWEKIIPSHGQEPLYAELSDFISAIKNDKSPQVSIDEALVAQEIAEEIEKKCLLS